MNDKTLRVAIVFPADPQQGLATRLEASRFAKTAEALTAVGLEVVGAPYRDEDVEAVRAILSAVDGVLVWINPIVEGRDRSVLNRMLAEVARLGVLVSAHPEVIDKIGTKEVLYRTRHLGWGSDIHQYRTLDELRDGLLASLSAGLPRVVKQARGHSGEGVWKVELAEPRSHGVRVRHAKRGGVEETLPLEAFLERCRPYLAEPGGVIDQAYQPRLTDGMVRCYLVRDRVAGFGEQRINALYPAEPGAPPESAPTPGPRLYYPPTRSDFQPLKTRLENDWLDELCRAVGLAKAQLPLLWDADFLYGPRDAAGADTWVLCEINVSSVYPFPDEALAPLAAATKAHLQQLRG
ncbi:MAG TPA: Cj0069 family protein [Thermoanaerobaculia bacterium]|nr:Cj0069 family protein [Thermoanaerobaculia bacterium]